MSSSPLTPDRWRMLEEVLLGAWDLMPADRDAFLERRCAGDAALLNEVRGLLAASITADNWQEPEPSQQGSPSSPRAGPFELEHLIGRGGMGAVYLAHRADGHFEQKVAVKLVGLPLESASLQEGFRRERQILASLEHPNITRLLDGGVTSNGDLYLAMEYVDGTEISRYCSQPGRPISVRLRVFRQVCAAIQYAHQNLIVHCDIKPSNILVTHEGVAKVLDFGTGRLLSGSDFTQSGLGMITASYSSPEQLTGGPVSTLTDVYSLGVVLFEILAGKKLFTADLSGRLTQDALPAMPSSLASDLRRILNKALAANPAERYSSVEQFSEDIRRYLEGEPVLAHPPSLAYRSGKYLRRHKWAATLVLLSTLALAGATAFSTRQAQIASREADRARKIAKFSSQTFLSTVPGRLSPMSGHSGEITFKDLLENAGKRAQEDLASDPATELSVRNTLGGVWMNMGALDRSLIELHQALRLENLITDRPLENERALTLELLCDTASFQGDYKQARALCRESLDWLHKASRPEPDLACAIPHDLAYMSDKDDAPLKEVERLYRESAAAAQRYFGAADIRYYNAMSRAAACRYEAADLGEAELILEPAVEHIRLMPGPPVDLIPPLRTLGAVRRTQGRLQEAEAIFTEALNLIHKRPTVVFSADLIELNLLLVQALSGKAVIVAPRARQIVQIETQSIPAGHVDRILPELVAGAILVLAHENGADILLRDAASISHDKRPLRPALEAEADFLLAQSLAAQGKTAEAASVSSRATRLFQQTFGTIGPDAKPSRQPDILLLPYI